MATFDSDVDAALARGAALARTEHKALAARFDATTGRLVVAFDNGVEMATPVALLGEPFASATSANLADVRIEGGGYDLYWPGLDEGIYLPDMCADVTYGRLAA